MGSPGGDVANRARFRAGQKVKCLWRDGEYWKAEIVGRERIKEKDRDRDGTVTGIGIGVGISSPRLGVSVAPTGSPMLGRTRVPDSPSVGAGAGAGVESVSTPSSTARLPVTAPAPAAAAAAAAGSQAQAHAQAREQDVGLSVSVSVVPATPPGPSAGAGAGAVPSPSVAATLASPTVTDHTLGTWRYYIHYVDFNRRLEEWLVDDGRNILPDIAREAAAAADRKKRPSEGGQAMKKKKKKYAEMKKQAGQQVQRAKQRSSGALIIEDEEKERHAGIMRNVELIQLGRLGKRHVDKMWICDTCLKHHESLFAYERHIAKCKVAFPPGTEIYRFEDPTLGTMTVFEVDGARMWEYSQNLCLLAKLFLDDKNLQYDTDPFYFYVFTQVGPELVELDGKPVLKHHICGYFSREKDMSSGHNLACILTLPPFQRIGLGKMLIAFSYGLSLKEGAVGTPEKPLSDLGYRSYHAYWREVLIELLVASIGDTISINEISVRTGMNEEDIVTTLNDDLAAFRYLQGGKHALCVSDEMLKQYERNRQQGRGIIEIDQSRLNWVGHGVVDKGKKR